MGGSLHTDVCELSLPVQFERKLHGLRFTLDLFASVVGNEMVFG